VTLRIALALLVIVPAALAYPWQTTTDYWIIGAAAVVVIVVFAWWRGMFVTAMIAARFAIFRRNHGTPTVRPSNRATVVLQVAGSGDASLPLATIAGYVDRFGIRCDKVRITSLDESGVRSTWVSVTLDAADNLAALQARSPQLPLTDTVAVVTRRLVGHLRETGVEAVIADTAPAPSTAGRERWRTIEDGTEFVSVYAIAVDEHVVDRLASVWAHPSQATWLALEFSGTATHPTVSAAVAFRGDAASASDGLAGVVPIRGGQRPVLTALDPRSVERLGTPLSALTSGLLDGVTWRAVPNGATLARNVSRT
jgi:type VII secretion protein EccE